MSIEELLKQLDEQQAELERVFRSACDNYWADRQRIDGARDALRYYASQLAEADKPAAEELADG